MREDLSFQTYLAVFVDLLGQKFFYERIADIPGDEDLGHRAEFEADVLSFARSIYHLKEDVEKFFRGYDSYQSELPWPEELQPLRDKMKRYVCKRQRLSDGLILFIPLKADDSHFPLGSVYRALAATAQLMLMSLARGTPIRGGIAIGGGLELEDGELFGPVIGRAHHMESRVSQYPRITVHESVLRYIAAHQRIGTPATEDQAYLKLAANLCSGIIVNDLDGVPILHYLGDPFWTGLRETGGMELLDRARRFVSTELERFRSSGESKLAMRYAILDNYLRQTDGDAGTA